MSVTGPDAHPLHICTSPVGCGTGVWLAMDVVPPHVQTVAATGILSQLWPA